VLGRLVFACLLATTVPALAAPPIEIHASCAANVIADAQHLETLRSELARALAHVSQAHVIDASLVAFETRPTGNDIEVHVEVRALVSDSGQHAHWVTTARATAQGRANDRKRVERDAISAAARELGTVISTR
jgi:hypothetical protein